MTSPESSISHDRVSYVRWMGNNFGDNLNDLYFRNVLGIKIVAGMVRNLKTESLLLGLEQFLMVI